MNLNMMCPINGTSYGITSAYFMSHLSLLGWDIRHIGIGQNQLDPYMAKKVNLNWRHHYDAPTLKIWHQFDMVMPGKVKMGFPIFELEDFNEREDYNLRYPDYLFVCSQWAKDVLVQNGHSSDKIRVVPLGFDENIFKPSEMMDHDATIFANFGKWEIRKGHDVLIKAFEAAFNPSDNVGLVMMPTNAFLSENQTNDWMQKYTRSKLGHKIQIIPRVVTQEMVYNIMRQVHCGVFPARAEGFNLEAIELLAAGKDLIITNCTGHTEFVNSKNSRLIEMNEEFEPAYDGVFFNGTLHWRKFGKDQFDQLVEHMRDYHKNRPCAPNKNGLDTAHKFTWSKSASKLSLFMKDIYASTKS